MDETMKGRLTSGAIWMRGLYMLLFVLAYSIAELVITALVVLQFLIVLFTGRGNENLLRLGNNLSAYVYQIVRFETFNSETRPYPFAPWPDEPVEDNAWLQPLVTVDGVSEATASSGEHGASDAEEPAADQPDGPRAEGLDPRTLP